MERYNRLKEKKKRNGKKWKDRKLELLILNWQKG
jgi:hypothetical protein